MAGAVNVSDLNLCDMDLNERSLDGRLQCLDTSEHSLPSKPSAPTSQHSRSLAQSRNMNLPQILTTTDPDPPQDGRMDNSDPTDGSVKSSLASFHFCSPTSCVTSASPLRSPRSRSLGDNLSTQSLEALLGGNTSLKLARDPHQPHSGSITDIHTEVSVGDDEESDVFDLAPMQRPRARTWSENRAWQRMRKARIKAMSRPPTPPPGGTDRFMVEMKMQSAVSKEKLKIPDRELPGLPESST